MSSQGAEQLSFDFLPHLPVVVQPTAGQMSSDAGLLPLRQFDRRWKYTTRMPDCLHDPKPRREQSLDSMLRQRIFGILAGCEDCNDHDTLRDDPVFKLITDRLPDGKTLASRR
jgi:Transposase DDE domain group 1